MNRKFVVVLALFACAMVGIGISRSWLSRPSTIESAQAAPAGVERPDDEQCAALLKDSNNGEAIAWLTQDAANRGVARWEKPEAIELIQGFYAAGAGKISVVDAEKVGQTEVAAQFVIELPANTAARKKVFAKEAEFEAQYEDEPTPDQGQKYLHITTD